MFAIRSIGAMLFACVAISVSAEGLSLYGENILDAPLAAAAPSSWSPVSPTHASFSISGDMSSIKFGEQPAAMMSSFAANSPTLGVEFRHTSWQPAATTMTVERPDHATGLAGWQTFGIGPSSELISTSFEVTSPTLNHSTESNLPLIGEELMERGWRVNTIGNLPR